MTACRQSVRSLSLLQSSDTSSKDTANNPSGLFSIPELQRPSDFDRLTQEAIRNCNDLRNQVATALDSQLSDVAQSVLLHKLDDISKHVCNVIDAAELCRSVHIDPSWKEASNNSFSTLADFMSVLNADQNLYKALQKVTPTNAQETRFVKLLRAEFERDGIHLNDEKRSAVRDLQNEITQLETSFSENLLHARKLFAVEQMDAVLDVIPKHVLQTLDGAQYHGDTLQLNNNDSQIMQTLVKYSPDPLLRKQIYLEHHTAVPENLLVLDELVKARHELSVLQGFPSFADRNLVDKMAQSTEAVLSFLETALSRNETPYRADMTLLSQAKQKVEGTSELEPWDLSFYTDLVKSRNGDPEAAVSQYLTLPKCLEAMQILVEKLFGIEMKELEMAPSERWDTLPGHAVDESRRLRKFEFVHSNGQPLGTLLLDLFPRDGKYGHAAHFTIRCGCALNWEDSDTDYQLPVVALVCNLSAGTRLTHSEVETLFHEFGHSLHSLLSRATFQHMSGTRGAMDFVETPSHLLENFVWDPEFLRILAVDPESGRSVPDQVVSQLRKSRYDFASIERQNQILYALFDQQLFGVPLGIDSTSLIGNLHDRYGVPYAKGTHWHSRFGHLVSYGAGYYAYLYAQIFARDIWNHSFKGNSLSRRAGLDVWHKVLRFGGARDPEFMLTDLLGRPPVVDFTV